METKICSCCKTEQSIENFRWRNKAKGTKHSQCKTCESTKEKARYAADIQRKRDIVNRTYEYKDRNVRLVDDFKSQGCQKCGENRAYVLECHHVNPSQKGNNIAHMIKSASEENLKRELQLCVCLCANCHREFHYLQKINENLSIQSYLNGSIAQSGRAQD